MNKKSLLNFLALAAIFNPTSTKKPILNLNQVNWSANIVDKTYQDIKLKQKRQLTEISG